MAYDPPFRLLQRGVLMEKTHFMEFSFIDYFIKTSQVLTLVMQEKELSTHGLRKKIDSKANTKNEVSSIYTRSATLSRRELTLKILLCPKTYQFLPLVLNPFPVHIGLFLEISNNC